VDRSPALVLRFAPQTSAAARDRLVALLSDHSLLAIQEDDVAAPTMWVAHFADASARDGARAALERVPDLDGLEIEAIEIEDDDWARRTQADLPAVSVGRITVAPPWDLPPTPLPDDHILVVIEPSRGFGTGHHQSTRLCLRLLQDLDLAGLRVVDVGTGSGVLAIAAARLGATSVTGIDDDPDAVENARENFALNAVAGVVDARVEDALAGRSGAAAADVVTANLTGTLLARHAPAVAAYAKPDGRVVVSGFTIDERDRVVEAFAPGLEVAASAEEDDWWGLILTRPR
jgi:ribosomal protein L11 methyltransferase